MFVSKKKEQEICSAGLLWIKYILSLTKKKRFAEVVHFAFNDADNYLEFDRKDERRSFQQIFTATVLKWEQAIKTRISNSMYFHLVSSNWYYRSASGKNSHFSDNSIRCQENRRS